MRPGSVLAGGVFFISLAAPIKGLAEEERGEGVNAETFLQELIEDLDTREAKRKAG